MPPASAPNNAQKNGRLLPNGKGDAAASALSAQAAKVLAREL
jgi:hypothetical protein